MTRFIPGLQLSELFYKKVVKNLVETEFPELKYSAALIGSGSEVLGFDTERSTDHHWGPRVMLFLSKNDFEKKKQISDFLGKNLPTKFKGYSTHFGDPGENGVQLLSEAKEGQAINHRVEIYTIASFFKDYLEIDISDILTTSDWLTLSEQKLRTIRSGNIFHDQVGLKQIQKKLHYYPKDVWLFMLASEWQKIGQEEPFVARCGDAGDEIGSKIISARLIQTIMRLCFLMEKEYAPYSKWFGTAFLRLRTADELSLIFNKVFASKNWEEREKYLSQAYKIIAQMHNDLKLTEPLPIDVSCFHDRPYKVIHGDIFTNALKEKIKDPEIKRISANIGSVNQLTNTVDLLENDKLLKKLKVLYK